MRFLRPWWWAILLVLVLIVRMALPAVLRAQIEARASEALHATVTVGDVDLALLAGGVALDDVSVRATDAPPSERPLVAWKRFAVDLRWLPLFRKTVRLSSVELVEPDVALDRLQSGDLNLAALVPKSETKEGEAPAAEPSGWKFGIDYVGLHRGGVRFRDLLLPDAEPLLLNLQSIEVKDIAFEPDVYGEPANIRFVVRLDEGVLRTRARFTPLKEGMAVDVTIDGTKLPVHRSRVYVPGVAWSDLTGLLSLALRYRLETGGRNELSGTIGLDDLTVWTSGLEEPALTWKSLGVELEKIDLVKHEARVKRVAVGGAVVPVRPRGPDPLPLLVAAKAAAAAAKAEPAPPGEEAPPAPPWSWRVASLSVAESRARLLSDRPPLDVGVTLDASGLSGPEHDSSPVKLGLAIGEGTVGIDGTLRIAPIGFAGAVTSGALDVPAVVDVVGAMPPGVLQVAKLDADLKVALGSSAPTPGDATLSGTTAVSDLWVAANDPSEFAAGAKRIDVAIDDAVVPGVLAAGGPGGRASTTALRTVDVAGFYARVTRTETGILLPAFTAAEATATPGEAKPPADAKPAAEGAPAPETPRAATEPPAQKPVSAAKSRPAPADATAATAAPAAQVTVERVGLAGRLDVTDRTVKPFYWNAFDPVEATLEKVRAPELQIGSINLHAVSATKGTIDVKGAILAKSDLEIVVKDLAMMPFNPYVTGISPYSVSRGALFITTKAKIDGPTYDTTTYLTLSDFDLASRSGKHVVIEQLGVPLTVAIALLRDWRGNIDLTIPVKVDEKGTAVGLGTVVSGALVRALVGTLMSPLKVLGAVLPRGGEGGDMLAPVRIRFRPGLSTADAAAEEQMKQLATFLASRPGLGATLASPATPADLRALRERALLAKLGPSTGVLGRIRSVGARGRIVGALEARASGDEGALDADDAKTLDEYLEDVPAPSEDEIKRLADARIEVVEKTLREKYGIQPGQLGHTAPEAGGAPAEGEPGVSVELGSARPG